MDWSWAPRASCGSSYDRCPNASHVLWAVCCVVVWSGDVRKIIIFNKNNVFKALVQMGSIDSAVNAKLLLEGKDMFQGCCHLRIGFSSLQDLRVQQNGPRARVSSTHTHATQQEQRFVVSA